MKPARRFSLAAFSVLMLNAFALSHQAQAQTINESFNDITTLAATGWVQTNGSIPVGSTNWFQGNPQSAGGPFDAYQGAANAYIGANFNNTSGGTGIISNWLLLPNRTLRNGDTLSFYTRRASGATEYPDRLEIRLSSNGASNSVGTGNGTGDFATLLLSINPNLTTGIYPSTWTQFTATVSGLSAPTSGRLAFRYYVTSAGPAGSNSDYIGIDEVSYSPYTCPSLTVNGAPPQATVGSSYSSALSTNNAIGSHSFSVSSGNLPPGLSLSASGLISGVPTVAGNFNFTVTLIDSSGCTGSANYSLTVDQAQQVVTFPVQSQASRWFYAGDTFDLDPLAISASPNSGLPITYTSENTSICSISDTTITMVSAGSCQITANQAGDDNYLEAAPQTVTIDLVIPTQADIQLSGTGSAEVVLGNFASYSVTVSNIGPADAENIRVQAAIPTRIAPSSFQWSCQYPVEACSTLGVGTGALDITLPSLPRQATLTFEFTGQVIGAPTPEDDLLPFNFITTAELSGGSLTDPAPSNNQISITTQVINTIIFLDGFEAVATD